MKESRLIIIISSLMLIALFPLYYFLKNVGLDLNLVINIITNFVCALIVALVTAICNFATARKSISNRIYTLYFDLYITCYYSKNNPFLNHINAKPIIKKLGNISLDLNSILSEYYGFFRKHDSYYKKIDYGIKLNENHKINKLIKAIYKLNNKKEFELTFIPIMNGIEKILKSVDERRFNIDRENMIKLFNYIVDKG